MKGKLHPTLRPTPIPHLKTKHHHHHQCKHGDNSRRPCPQNRPPCDRHLARPLGHLHAEPFLPHLPRAREPRTIPRRQDGLQFLQAGGRPALRDGAGARQLRRERAHGDAAKRGGRIERRGQHDAGDHLGGLLRCSGPACGGESRAKRKVGETDADGGRTGDVAVAVWPCGIQRLTCVGVLQVVDLDWTRNHRCE